MAVSVPPGFYSADNKRRGRIRTGQVAVGANKVLLLPENMSRLGVVVTNTGTATVFIGAKDGDLANTGHALPSGVSIGLVSSAELFAVSSAGTNICTYLEEVLRA